MLRFGINGMAVREFAIGASRSFLTAFIVVLIAGCGQDASDVERVAIRSASYRQGSAKEFLASVFTRYRNASGYRDSAFARISFEQDGRFVSRTIPMRVWLNHAQVYVAADGVRIWSDGTTMNAWIRDAETDDFDSQVIRQSVQSTGRPDLNLWLQDQVLAGLLEEGVAGPPPQLDWLFSSRPMERLFDDDNQFAFGADREVDGHLCVAVKVLSKGDRFRFWVDAKDGLIRRVDLPPPASEADAQQAESKLSIELAGASFDVTAGGPKMDSLPARPQFVRQFVRLPPEPPPASLGLRPRPFRLTTEDGSFTVTELGSDRPITILVRADAAGSNKSVASLQHWRGLLPPDLRRQIRIAVVDSPSAPSDHGDGFSRLMDHGHILSGGLQMMPGSVVLIGGGQVVWTQRELRIEGLAAFGAVIADALQGVDIPRRYREQWQAETKHYRERLGEQMIPAN